MGWVRVLPLVAGLFLAGQAAAATSFSRHFSLVPESRSSGDAISRGVDIDRDSMLMAIKQTLLGTSLLFMPTLVTDSTPEGLPISFGAKRVFFERRGASLFLMENMEGRSIPGPFKPEKIIAEFPIVDATNEAITFDFRKGFETLIIQLPGFYGRWGDLEFAVPVNASYLRDAIAQDDLFAFHHVVQVGGRIPATATFSYGFIPDRIPSFTPIPAPEDLERLGYFTTFPTYTKGVVDEHLFISRWDISKPIVFTISPNTPMEFRGAVREGIEAWNEVFGKKVLVAEEAPEGRLIGDFRHNMVQWVDMQTDQWALAYADYHVHPLSGEILHSNVIFLSAWAIVYRDDAERLLKYLDDKESRFDHRKPEETTEETPRTFALRGFKPQVLCDGLELDTSYRHMLERIISGEISEEKILPLMQRMVKAVVMHEIGHDLGLRHNFAGSLATQISPSKDEADLTSLLFESVRVLDGFLPSSSIMDYLVLEDDIRMDRPGDYDRAAIRWGYLANEEEREKMWFPPFCTDGDYWKDADCERRDAWAEPISWRSADAARKVKLFNRELLARLENIGSDDQTSEEEKELRPRWLRSIIGLFRYASDDMEVHSLLGVDPEKRRQRAGEALAPYIWTAGFGPASPVGSIVTPATIKEWNAFNGDVPADAVTGERIKLLHETIQGARKETLEWIIGELMWIGTSRLRSEFREPLFIPLAGLGGNAGLDTWFADEDDFRRFATFMVSSGKSDVALQARQKLTQRLRENIAELKRFLATTSAAEGKKYLQERIRFEEELLSILPSSLGRPPSRD